MFTWTEEKVEMLRTLWLSGKSGKEISTMMGEEITRNAIIGKAHRLGLTGRPSPIKKKKPASPHTTFMQLTERMCKWPFGDPKKSDFHFCGKPADVSVPYCREHIAIAYTHPAPRAARSQK